MRLLLAITLTCSLAHADLDTAPLEAWLARQSSVKTIKADFVQERTLPALKKPTTSSGTFTMERPGKLRWELGVPAKTIAVSDGTTMTLADVAKKEARTFPADSSQAKQFTLLSDGSLAGNLESFTQTFELIESRVTNGIYQLTTRPKARAMRQKVSWVYLDIDPAKKELRALELRLDDKSSIRTIFSNTRINQKIPTSAFTLDLSSFKVH